MNDLRQRTAILLAAVAVLAPACGDGEGGAASTAAATGTGFPAEAVAVRASSDLATGPERLLIGVSLPDGTRLGSPDDPVTIAVAPAADPDAVQQEPGLWTWMVPGGSGLYRANFDFDVDGLWEATLIPEGGDPLDPVPFSVVAGACRDSDSADEGRGPCAPRIGEPAPVVASPTLADAPLQDLTTDPDPDERLYQVGLDEALTNGRRTVIIFSTPAYCTTAACGPLLENVKEVVGAHPEVDFVHVEVFTGFNEPGFAPDAAHLAPAITAYDLPTEPWVFVTDEAGVIVARYEGVLDPTELLEHLD